MLSGSDQPAMNDEDNQSVDNLGTMSPPTTPFLLPSIRGPSGSQQKGRSRFSSQKTTSSDSEDEDITDDNNYSDDVNQMNKADSLKFTSQVKGEIDDMRIFTRSFAEKMKSTVVSIAQKQRSPPEPVHVQTNLRQELGNMRIEQDQHFQRTNREPQIPKRTDKGHEASVDATRKVEEANRKQQKPEIPSRHNNDDIGSLHGYYRQDVSRTQSNPMNENMEI